MTKMIIDHSYPINPKNHWIASTQGWGEVTDTEIRNSNARWRMIFTHFLHILGTPKFFIGLVNYYEKWCQSCGIKSCHFSNLVGLVRLYCNCLSISYFSFQFTIIYDFETLVILCGVSLDSKLLNWCIHCNFNTIISLCAKVNAFDGEATYYIPSQISLIQN